MRNCSGAVRLYATASLGAALLVTGPSEALANGPEVINSGACLVPVSSSVIQLTSVHVTVRVPKDNGLGGSVNCRYLLSNPTSSPVTITMAFVVGAEGRLEAVSGLEDSGFNVRADGVAVRVSMQSIRGKDWTDLVTYPPGQLPSWRVTVPADGSTDLRIEYSVWWGSSRTDEPHPYSVMKYHARAARLWAASIGIATIEFDLTNAGGHFWRCVFDPAGLALGKISPEGFDWTDEGVRWVFHDWVPEEDFEVRLPDACETRRER